MSSSFDICFVTFSEDGVHDHLYVCQHPCAPGRALLAAMRCSHSHSLSRLQAHKTSVSALVTGMPTWSAPTHTETCVYIQSCTTIACDSFRYNGILFRAIFAYASGPLAIAVFIFRNNLVPFDPDHTTSVRCYCFIAFNF